MDSDWAGSADRRSTSGGIIMMEGVAVKHWSRTQKTRAMSSGEAEYYGIVTGCAEGLGLKSLCEDLGLDVDLKLWTDSTAGKSVAGRKCLGKLRHMEVKYLWLQEEVRKGLVRMIKVKGVENPADCMTKYLNLETMKMYLEGYGFRMLM